MRLLGSKQCYCMPARSVAAWMHLRCQSLTGACCARALVGADGKSLPVPVDLPNAHMRLFGSTYHCRLAELWPQRLVHSLIP